MSDDRSKVERLAMMAAGVTSAEFRDQMAPALDLACRGVADGIEVWTGVHGRRPFRRRCARPYVGCVGAGCCYARVQSPA